MMIKITDYKDLQLKIEKEKYILIFFSSRDCHVYEAIWKEAYNNDKGTIMVRVSSIRNKLPKLDIESIRGQGYRLTIS